MSEIVKLHINEIGLNIDNFTEWLITEDSDKVINLNMKVKIMTLETAEDVDTVFSILAENINRSPLVSRLIGAANKTIEDKEKEISVLKAQNEYLIQYKNHYDLEIQKFERQNSHLWRKE